MKRILTICLLSLAMLSGTMVPANAIFGLSQCEKVKKQIKNEVAIGDTLFKSYRFHVSLIKPKTDGETFRERYLKYEDAINSLDLVLDSDIKAWSTGQNYPQCFSVEQNSGIRTGLKIFKESSKNTKASISKKDYFEKYNFSKVYTSRMNVTKVFFKK